MERAGKFALHARMTFFVENLRRAEELYPQLKKVRQR